MPQSPHASSSTTTHVTGRIASASISTIASASFLTDVLLLTAGDDPFDDLDVLKGHRCRCQAVGCIYSTRTGIGIVLVTRGRTGSRPLRRAVSLAGAARDDCVLCVALDGAARALSPAGLNQRPDCPAAGFGRTIHFATHRRKYCGHACSRRESAAHGRSDSQTVPGAGSVRSIR